LCVTELRLGLGVGTTNIKCLAIDGSANILAQAGDRTTLSHPQPGWTDFDPKQIWAAACRTARAVVCQRDSPTAVRGIAVASVAKSLTPIDSDGNPVAPAIAWFDLRTTSEYDWLCDRIGYDRLFRVSGLNPDPMFGICKILWLKNHSPKAFARAKCWLHLADYVAFRLSGVAATDPSLACRTLSYNIFKGS